MSGTTLRQLLHAIGDPLLDLHPADAGLDATVSGITILDPDDELGSYPEELVLVIGARGREAIRYVRAAARRGATAAAVKVDPAQQQASGNSSELRTAAAEAGIALLAVRPDVRWDQLETLMREVLGAAAIEGEEGTDDLFSLAQTLAVLTAGSVTIEDAGNRVLAYSRSDDEVDELRRLSILGWEGPEQYLAKLREWGVFQRLRVGEEVVRIAERPDFGIRRRLAIGIRAGTQHLGTIWVQEGREPIAERAESALLGAARVAATHLLRQRNEAVPGRRSRQDLASGLLDGRISPDLVAGNLGLDPARPVAVIAFDARPGGDGSATELNRAELVNAVSVQVTSFRRAALVTTVGSRVYALLPDVPARAEQQLRSLAEEIVRVLWRRVRVRVRAGIGSPLPGLAQVGRVRGEADRVVDAMGRKGKSHQGDDQQGSDPDVATIADLRAEVLLSETLAMLEGNPDLRDPAVAALGTYDGNHGTELSASLLAFLDSMGDVRGAATALHVHPNTLRHRIRRATAVSGIDLDDPRARLLTHLQLVLATRAPE
ncbi:transcriptional regulator [Amycolatopsis antarctica]|uniref:Transcriptional regulator n=1 Tax=Amycolatopsis antarctica TaxID=1854586 RepID=A0A263CW13_9PSEU|nr:helix-turn-helix domain-containing protein [Amycolatopsis antarctica]OZM70322.1 transcriptional regulator [Amycolatopsis antarctica]